jgi:predicted CoA-binding protein
MDTGYAILCIKPGMKKEFLQNIRVVKGIQDAKLVIGICDIIVKIQADSFRDIESIYFNKIDKMRSVANSRLLLVACPRTRK